MLRIQCFPGKIGRLESNSARIHPMDQISTGREEQDHYTAHNYWTPPLTHWI